MEQARFYPRYLGIDANRAHVEEARRLNGGNKRATFYEADLVAWGGCKDAPDAIVCLQCLEHVPKKEALWALRQWVGIVRPRGLVVVGCPVDHRGQRFHDLDRERRMEHRWIPVFEELIEYMEGLGCRTLAADST